MKTIAACLAVSLLAACVGTDSLQLSNGEGKSFLVSGRTYEQIWRAATLAMATGLLRPTYGTASVLGHDVWTDPPAAKAAMGVMPDGMRLFAGGLQSGGAARMVVYARDAATGAITGIGSTLVAAITLGFIRWKGARE